MESNKVTRKSNRKLKMKIRMKRKRQVGESGYVDEHGEE